MLFRSVKRDGRALYIHTNLSFHKANAWWKDRLVRLFSALPSLFTHGIWWPRNTAIFNNKLIPIGVTSALVIQWAKEHRSQEKEQIIRVLIPPEINKAIPWAFFDGAIQGDPPLGAREECSTSQPTKRSKQNTLLDTAQTIRPN